MSRLNANWKMFINMSILLFVRSVGLLTIAFGLTPLFNVQNDQAGKAKLGSMSGRLHDQFGAVVANARIIVTSSPKSTDNNAIETVSNVKGEFKIDNLPSGVYSMRIEGQGFDVFFPYSVVITNNKTIELNVRLDFKETCDGEINNSRYILTDAEKASIIRQVLEHVFVIRDWAGPIDVLEEEGQLPLHTENIKPAWVREHLPKGIFLLNDVTQHKKGGVEDIFHYLEFSEFEVKGNCVTIALIHNLTGTPTLGTGAYIYEFRKHSSQWVGKCIGGWVS